MTLTLARGPLASAGPETVNYRIEGPAHRLFFHEFPRRVRAFFGGAEVLDSTAGMLLHESNLLPQLYVPVSDLDATMLRPTDHTTHCPFKGDAAYWSVTSGELTATNAVWAYQEPMPAAGWLRGYMAAYWQAMDTWYDEDEEVFGHVRDPYHRVDVRTSGRHVQVVIGDEVVADSHRPLLLSETGLPNRYYLAPEDVRTELLEISPTHTVCPYKGTASYRNVTGVDDATWSYPEPLEQVARVRGHFCFASGPGVQVLVDGEAHA